MSDSINNKAKEYYDNDNTGGSLNSNLKDFLKQQGAEGNSLNTLWRNYAYGEGGNSLNTRLGKLWGTSGSLVSRWKEVLGLTWDDLKLFFNARRNDPELLLSGATSFDGSDDYIDTGIAPRALIGNSNPFTFSAWAKANDDDNEYIIGSMESGAERFYLRFRDPSGGTAYLRWGYGGTGDSNTDAVVTLNTWHHVAWTYDSSSAKLYIDGSLKNTQSISGQTISNTDNLFIGAININGTASNFFNGSIANVGIWNRALSSSEIESIYWKGQYADLKGTELTNLVSWYNLSADANDSTGTNNGTNNGATFLTDAYSASSPFLPRIQDKATPKGAVALASGSTSFATDDYISLPSLASTIGDGALTFAGWFKTNTITDYYPLYIGTPSSNANYIVLKINSNGTILTQARSSGTVTLTSTATITAGNWHHIAVTRSGTTGTLYVDGTSVTSTDSNWGVTVGSETTLGAFRIASNSGFYTGSMANVAIYSDAKTQSQIQDIMFSSYSTLTSALKTNLVSWYDLGSTGLSSNKYNSTSGWTAYGNNTIQVNGLDFDITYVDNGNGIFGRYNNNILTSNVLAGAKYEVSFDAFYTGGSAPIVRYYTDAYTTIATLTTESTNYKYIHTPVDSTNDFINFKTNSGNVVSVKNFSFKEIQATDAQGDNEGSIYGATTNTGYTNSPSGVADPLNYGEVYGGNAVSFDGTNDYIDLGTPSDVTGDKSVSMWFKQDTNGNRFLFNFDFINMNCADHATNNKFLLYDSEHGNKFNFTRPELGIWNHLAITSTSSGSSVYLNGVSVSDTGDLFWGMNTDNTIGSRTSSFLFDGMMSGVKVFSQALTQDQVRELYTKPELTLPTGIAASALKLDMPMQEGSGVAILDGSGNQNHGTGSGITWANGQEYGFQHPLVRSNNPMVFDGSDDKVSVSIGQSNDYSISAWFKVNTFQFSGIVEWGEQATGKRRSLFLWNGGSGEYKVYSSTYGSNIASSTSLSTGVWYHGVVTVDVSNGSAKIYLNGSLDGTGTNTINSFTGSTGYIGTTGNDEFFNGIINEVAVWDRILDANEVTALYNSGLPLLPTADSGNYASADDLVGYWRNDGVTTWLDKANTGVASFDGTDDYLSVADSSSLDFSGGFSINYWVKPNSADNNDRMVTKGTTGNGQWMVSFGGSSAIRVYAKDNNGNAKDFSSSNTLTLNSWSMVTVVVNRTNNTVQVYKNGGNLSQSTSADWDTGFNNSVALQVGRISSSGYLDGQMANVSIWNHELSLSEVSELYAIDKRNSISGFSQFSNCVASWLMGAGTGDTTSTIQDQTSNNNDATVSGANLIGYNDGTVSGSPASIIVPEGLNEGRDSQGYYLTDTDSISSGIRFKGAEYISVQDSETLSFGNGTSDSPFSLEAWAKMDDATSFPIVMKGVYNSNAEWHLSTQSGNELFFILYDESVSNTYEGAKTSAITSYEGQWIHVVGTYDGRGGASANDGLKIYINGSSQSLTLIGSGTYVSMENLNANIEIGKTGSSTFAKGSIDEAKVYSKELSATEVLKNYNNGKSAHSN